MRVGCYKLGFEWVDLFVDGPHSGRFNLCPHEGEPGRVTIGYYDGHYALALPTLLHELLEYSMCRTMARYTAAPATSRSSSGYLFVMDHEKFAEVAQQVGEFLVACEKDLKTALRESKKQ